MLNKIIRFASEEFTPFAPYWDYMIAEGQTYINFAPIIKEILDKEKEIINRYEYEDDWGTKLGPNSLTSRSNRYNLLEFESTSPVKDTIRTMHDEFLTEMQIPMAPGPLYVQCWANVMRKKQKIATHCHGFGPWGYLSGHLCVQVKDTSTYYHKLHGDETWASPNKDGKITLFPSWVRHYTDSVKDDQERITIAFDIMTEEGYLKTVKDDMKSHWVPV